MGRKRIVNMLLVLVMALGMVVPIFSSMAEAQSLPRVKFIGSIVVGGEYGSPEDYIVEKERVLINPPSSSVHLGDIFNVEVRTENAVDLASYHFEMYFDSDVVGVLDVADGGFLGSTGREVIPGFPIIDVSKMPTLTLVFGADSFGDQPGPSGDGILTNITLEAVGVGDSPLDLHNAWVKSTIPGRQILPPVKDGIVHVTDYERVYLPLILKNSSSGPQPTAIQIAPTTSSVHRGQTFDVEVRIENADDLGGYQFSMDFDPAVVQVTNVEDGGFLGSTGRAVIPLQPVIGNRTLSFAAVSAGTQPGPDGDGALAVITLEAVGIGDSPLALHDVKVFNTAAEEEIPDVVEDGTVTVYS
ncbi:MAG: cohesin domain-containing protein [Chloroflexota bacterium]|nr:cohesin domain-containing protein [Chloroflexota bacterium]